MVHCFKCGADLPDNLNFCLRCGNPLDETETTIKPFPDTRRPEPPTAAASASGIGVVLKWLLALVAVAAIGILAVVAVFYVLENRPPPANQMIVITATPTPVVTPKRETTPRPEKDTVTPQNTNATRSNAVNVAANAGAKQCYLSNPGQNEVNLRQNCDDRDCSRDADTIAETAPNGTAVRRTGRVSSKGGKYRWVEVTVDGRSFWVAASKIRCD